MKIRKFNYILLIAMLAVGTLAPTMVSAKEAVTKSVVAKDAGNATKEELVAMRKADLEALMANLKSKHPNMYNKNNQAAFDKKLAEITGKLDTMNDMEFGIAVSELVALVGDSHTAAAIGTALKDNAHFLPISCTSVKEGLLLTALPEKYKSLLGGILTSINGVPIAKIKQKVTPMISYDNEVWQDKQFMNVVSVYEILAHYGVVSSMKDITLEVAQGEKIEKIKVNAMANDEMKASKMTYLKRPIPMTARDRSKMYWFKALDSKTLYIQYNACMQDEKLPMKTFAEQVSETLTKNGYSHVVLDLRYNGGGSDGVIRPLMTLLAEKNEQGSIKVYTLIGSNTFSSATINAVMMKEIGATMVGTPTGGSVNHFGATDTFVLPNSKIGVQYSTKYCDLTKLLKVAKDYGMEPFKPDLLAQQTREDYLLGKDTAVEAILSEVKK